MSTNNFHYSYFLADQLYGIEINDNDFEEIGLVAWNLIANKRVRLYRMRAKVDCSDNSVQVPCNAYMIEAVTRCGEDYQYTTNHTAYDNYDSNFVESYNEAMKTNVNPLYVSGGFIKYYQSGDTLYLSGDYGGHVNILYKGIVLDEEGLPELTDKEALAIATYVAYMNNYKRGLVTQNDKLIQTAKLLEQDWKRQCDAARVPEVLSQNDMDKILDAKSSWNRKIFNKSYKPVK